MRARADRSIAFHGAGAVATALGRALRGSGHDVRFSSRSFASARRAANAAGGRAFRRPADAFDGAGVVWLTVPDRAVEETCASLAASGSFRRGVVVAHASGFLSSRVLARARAAGARVASAHPLRSFAGAARGDLRGTVFALEGDAAAVARLASLVARIGGRAFEIPARSKPLYHAAAAVASNYTVVLAGASRELLALALPASGRRRAFEGVLRLLEGTVANLRRHGVERSLTGPIARGDDAVVRGHLAALRRRAPAVARLYATLGLRAADLGRAKGTLSSDAARRLRDILQPAASARPPRGRM